MKIFDHVLKVIRYIIQFNPYQPEEYWEKRVKDPGLSAVMWNNPSYNTFFDTTEKKKIDRYLGDLSDKKVLDLCCGIGRLSYYLADNGAIVYGVDLDEMVDRARKDNPHPRITYIGSNIVDMDLPQSYFDCVLSVGGVANACDTDDDLHTVLQKISFSLKDEGLFLSMDPYHKHMPFLMRPCRKSVKDIVRFCAEYGLSIQKKDGIGFIPSSIILTMVYPSSSLIINKILFYFGELVLMLPVVRIGFSDYKVLLFKRGN